MNLENKDKNTILGFIEKYRKIGEKINEMEFLIEKLVKEKDSLVSELEYTRQEEVSYIDDLIAKYGDKEVMDEIKNLALC